MKAIYIAGLALMVSGCLKDDPLNVDYVSNIPVEIDDGLVLSDPSSEGMDSEELDKIYREVYHMDDLWSLRSLLVFKNGNLVAEAYPKDESDRVTRHLIWSSTKQVLGILAGIALEKGVVPSLDSPLSQLLPGEVAGHPEKSGITFRHLITMHSGIDFNNDGISGQTDHILRQVPDDITEYILNLPQREEPGTSFHYNDGDPQLVSSIIQRAVDRPTDLWADEVFFSRIEVTNYDWVRYRDGTTLGGFGIETTPRELGKIALCVADSGRYKGVQVVPQEWIEEMTSVKVASTPIGYLFGYFWWIEPSRDMCLMWGHGGQLVFIIPSESLVVVMTSIPNTQGLYQIDADEAMPVVDRIIGACSAG